MPERLADCVGAFYQAASGMLDWQQAAQPLCDLVGAHSAGLSLAVAGGSWAGVLCRPAGHDAPDYSAYFHAADPYYHAARRYLRRHGRQGLGIAIVGQAYVPERDFLSSEFYADFARHYDRRHMMGGLVGSEELAPAALCLYRGGRAEAFGDEQRTLLQAVLPHLQRALELARHLGQHERLAGLGRAVLESLPQGLAVVDAELGLHFINAAGVELATRPGSGLSFVRHLPGAAGARRLCPTRPEPAEALRLAIAAVARGGTGGTVPLPPAAAGQAGGRRLVLMVVPLQAMPGQDPALPSASAAASGGKALVLILEQGAATRPDAELLARLFQLSTAEAEVARHLAGGVSAEQVARQRGVSLDTVRSQIRAILAKVEVASLREFEYRLGGLPAVPASASAPGGSR